MKINGFKIQQDIREAQEERNLLTERFGPALYSFPHEKREDLANLAQRLAATETRIAKLQLAQAKFNLKVQVEVGGNSIPLMLAVKSLGGVDRITNLWRGASRDGTRTNRRYGVLARKTDEVVAERTISVEQADEFRRAARKTATALRAAIQQGNSQEVEASEIGYPA